jgi:hypothetical protein
MRTVSRLRVLSALFLAAGCRHGVEVVPPPPAAGAHYADLYGQRYRTRVDLYLFTRGDDDYKYLGRHDRLPALPPDVLREHVGRTEHGLTILDVVPAGSELVVVAETHEVTPESGIREKAGYPMGLICRLVYGGRERAGVLSEFIQAGEAAPPQTPNQRIDEAIATRIAE